MHDEQIRYDVAAGVLTLTLDGPDRLNAFTARMGDELRHAFDRADADDEVRTVVVTGSGPTRRCRAPAAEIRGLSRT